MKTSDKKRRFGGWVPVWAALPRLRHPVLILTDYGGIAVAYLTVGEKGTYISWTDAMRAEHGYGSVIGWRELPELPELRQVGLLLDEYGKPVGDFDMHEFVNSFRKNR